MVWDLALAFVALVAASYIGTTMALRGYFGREYHPPPASSADDGTDTGPSDA
jgi:hypothetical protein